MQYSPDCSQRIENEDLVAKAMSCLTASQRRVVDAFYIEEKPITQIAEEESLTVKAIDALLSRARLRLRAFGQSIQ